MKNFIGIDLGTTNSAISVYDGENLRLFKSPDQNDVTPSAIFFDKRGNKYIGKRAYDSAARSPANAATLFKRLMGTSTPIKLPAVDLIMTPEECSAEILQALFGYLPEEIRNDPETGTVITVPAAFNQMQKEATKAAAEMAGLGKVALMQEPVAAVMSVMRQRKSDGKFLVYDLGGGTLDIAIAQSISGRVSLLSHGGIAMCGGRDFDRSLFDNIVVPWCINTFGLPENFSADKHFETLRSMAMWAVEKAKIELSSNTDAVIAVDDSELRTKNNSNRDIYLDIPINRTKLDNLISSKIAESIEATRETLDKAGLSSHDIERIVFVGGPTQYKPLRDKVAFELGIATSTEVNPMTAVADGAALFAESIDWSSQSRGRKSGRGTLSPTGSLDLSFNYQARTQESKAKIVAKIGGQAASGTALQIDSLDTGWSSGKALLKDGAMIEVPLAKSGENIFKIFVFDAAGGPIKLLQDKISISRTASQIDAIPASFSVSIEALEKIGGGPVLHYLAREGDSLPKRGLQTFRATESLRAGSPGSINFIVREGNIVEPVTDNPIVGVFKILGTDIIDGVITKGADLILEYEVLDSGNVTMEVRVPSIGSSFNSGRNFYSRQRDDYSNVASRIKEESDLVTDRLDKISSKINDPGLDKARSRIERATAGNGQERDPESAKQAMDDIQEAKKLLAFARTKHLDAIRQLELDNVIEFFDAHVRQYARPAEESTFDNLAKTAQRTIPSSSGDFESHLGELRGKGFMILWRQDWFVIDRFKWLSERIDLFPDSASHSELCKIGRQALQLGEIDKLRQVVAEFESTRVGTIDENDMIANSNILVAGRGH